MTTPLAFRLNGPLDLDALWHAVQALAPQNGAGAAPESVAFTLSDVTDLADHNETDERLLRLVAEQALLDANAPAEPGAMPPLSARVYLLRDDECVVVLPGVETAPGAITRFRHRYEQLTGHAIADRDIADRYTADVAFRTGRHDGYAWWRPTGIDDTQLRELLRYWTTALSGTSLGLDLPTDLPMARRRSGPPRTVDLTLAAGLLPGLHRLAQETSSSAALVALTAFRVLLWRQTGRGDLAIGTLSGGRGPVGGTSPVLLRTPLLPDGTFAALVAAEERGMAQALRHSGLPYEHLARSLVTPYQLAAPVAGAFFRYADAEPDAVDGATGPVTFAPLSLEFSAAAHTLTLTVTPDQAGLRTRWTYDSRLLDEAMVSRIAARYGELLASALDHAHQPISALTTLCTDDLEQLRRDTLVATTIRHPERTVLDLVTETAAAYPEAVAVRDAAGSRTYHELQALSAHVARRLAALGLPAQSRVGLLLRRSADLPAVLLGVLRAGHAYVPLDPANPAGRLAYLLQDSGAEAVLTDLPERSGELPDGIPVVELRLASDPQEWLRTATLAVPGGSLVEEAAAAVHPEQLAYVIHTSGSTGQPKGVGVPHRAFGNLLQDMRGRLGCGPGSTLLATTTIGFDVAQLELFLPLISGGTVLMASAEEVQDPRALIRRAGDWRPSMTMGTPSTLRTMLAVGWPVLPELTVVAAGEALPPDLAAELRSRSGEVWNAYGPTETTVYSTVHRTGATDDSVMPIGGPVGGTDVHILDESLRRVPVGAVGELFIGGLGVARGYLGRPALTAERFLPDPYGADAGRRIYRTGDLVRLRADGALEYLGRTDQQIKIRGIRIEPGEIEHAALALPEVAECVVVAQPGAGGNPVLLAFVVPAPGIHVTGAEVEAELTATLTRSVLPKVVVLDALPLTPSGKADRKALPDFRQLNSRGEQPRSETERVLASVWSDVLGIADVPADQDFYDLGGHSLATVRLAFRIEREFGVDLDIHDLLERQTLAAQAQLIDRRAAGAAA